MQWNHGGIMSFHYWDVPQSVWFSGSPVAWGYQKLAWATLFMKLVALLGYEEFSSRFNMLTTMNSLGYLNCDQGYQD